MTEAQTLEATVIRTARLGRTRVPWFSLAFLVIVVVSAIFAPWIAPDDPELGRLRDRLIPPFWQEGGSLDHIFGTDLLGRDIFSRVVFGARVSLAVGFLSVAIAGTVGSIIGMIAGYYKGWVDSLLMRLTDMTLALPLILMAIVLVAILGNPSFSKIVLTIVILRWAFYARQVRGETLAVMEQPYIDLARISGASTRRILFRHVLPNVMPTLLVLATLNVALIILVEASLSFLGAGIPPPTPAWGLMVAEGRDLIKTSWWVSIIPGIAIFLTVLAVNLAGDWIRDRVDPKLRQI
jgi:peptide/nickel transport system permease protein